MNYLLQPFNYYLTRLYENFPALEPKQLAWVEEGEVVGQTFNIVQRIFNNVSGHPSMCQKRAEFIPFLTRQDGIPSEYKHVVVSLLRNSKIAEAKGIDFGFFNYKVSEQTIEISGSEIEVRHFIKHEFEGLGHGKKYVSANNDQILCLGNTTRKTTLMWDFRKKLKAYIDVYKYENSILFSKLVTKFKGDKEFLNSEDELLLNWVYSLSD